LPKTTPRHFPWKIHWKSILVESCLFLGAYTAWVIFRSPQASGRLFIGSLAILVPGISAVVLIFRSLSLHAPLSRRAWQFLGLGLVFWSLGSLVRTFYEAVRGIPAPTFSIADGLSVLAYPFFFSALVLHPFENPYAPSRFRFLLDVSITAGVVATLVWMMLGRSAASREPGALMPLVYPIADLILLMILGNMLLANRGARRTLLLWGGGLFSFLVSDYIYSLLAPVNGYLVGGLESLGWIVGGFLFGWGATFLAGRTGKGEAPDERSLDLGISIQKILPVVLVLVLIWFVLVDWRISGKLSWGGVWVGLILVLALVARMGVRAGEIELHRYWQLFSSMAQPIFICDSAGKIMLANPALVHALAFHDTSQIVGKNLEVMFDEETLPPDILQQAARQETSHEVRLRNRGIPYLLSLSPIFSEGRKVLLAGAAYDLSEQKRQQAAIQKGYSDLQTVHRQLEELNTQLEQKVEDRTQTLSQAYLQLEEQNKQLQELDRLKSDFVSMVSHELRTPLTSLNGGLELLLLQKGRSKKDSTTLSLMKDEVERLTRFVENILNLSSVEAGKIRMHLTPVSLEEVLGAVCNKPGINRNEKLVQVHLPADLPPVLADEDVLISIFNHLLDNAFKYAPGSPVVVKASCNKNRVRIQVSDRGAGIPEEKRGLLFQRFQRLEARDSQSVYGYGLGLYLSQRMLRSMKSDLVFEAPAEGGARFYFDLKAAK
jgi:PAS domain S-box-containing protein